MNKNMKMIRNWMKENDIEITDVIAHILILFILLIFLVLFSSCSRVVYRDIEKVTTDTMYIQKVDSFVNTIYKEKIKEVFLKDSSVITLNDSGKVKTKEIWHIEYIYVENKDSLNYYKSKLDSIAHKSSNVEKKEEVIENKKNIFDSLKQFFLAFLIVISFCFFYKITSLWLKK